MRIYTKKPLYMLKQTCARASTFTLNYFAMKFTFRRHETQLILYDGAKEMLRRAKIDPRTLDLDKLRADFSKMELQKKELLQACQSAEKEVRQMERELEKLEQYLGAERNDESEHKKINEQLR